MKHEWANNTLGELCEIKIGKTPYRDNKSYWDLDETTNNVWLSIADLRNTKDKTVYESKEHLSDKGAAICKIVKKSTLLLSFKLTLGRLAFAGRDLFTNEAIAALRIKNESVIGKIFLFYYLYHYDWQAATQGDVKIKGKTLNKQKLNSVRVAYPKSLSDQNRIVAILDEAFAGIATATANAERNLNNARELFESYLESVFVNKGEGWQEKSLSQLCDIKHGFAFKSEYFGNQGQYVLLTPGNFYETGGYRQRGEKQKYYCGEIPKDFILEKGDLLVAMTEQAAGLLGSPILIPEPRKYLHNQRLGLVTNKSGVPWVNEFFFHVFNTKAVRSEIHKSASGVKVRHTSPTKIGEVVVSFPTSVAEQKAIVSELEKLSIESKKLEATYTQKRTTLNELKQSVLHQAFSGQLH